MVSEIEKERIKFEKERKTFKSEMFETTEDNIRALHDIYEESYDALIPIEGVTYEEFVGMLVSLGAITLLQNKFKAEMTKTFLEKILR